MTEHNAAPVRLFLVVLATVLFFVAAAAWPAPVEPYRTKLIAAGLFCWCLSTFF
jgi:hypothetical protein